MNSQTEPKAGMAYAVGLLLTFLILALMIWIMFRVAGPQPINEDRVQKRLDARAAAEKARLEMHTLGWADQSKGMVRLPIEDAMELVVKRWENPEQARSNWLGRIEKFFPPPPPPAPEEPSPFE